MPTDLPDVPRMLGADWCPDCRRSKALLDRLGVAYEYVDLEADPDRYAEVELATNRRMTEIFDAALDSDEAEELARLCTGVLQRLKADAPPAG